MTAVRIAAWAPATGALAVQLLAVGAELAADTAPHPAPAGAYLGAVLSAAAVLVAARRPVTSTVLVLGVALVYHLAGYPGQGPAFALFVTAFLLARRPGPILPSLILAVGSGLVWSAIPTLPPHAVSWLEWGVLGPALAIGLTAAVSAALAAGAREARAEHDARSAALRAEVAREIHDVLAHTVAGITVQTSLALDAVGDDPELATVAMRRVRDLARSASPQLRESLLRLRDDDSPAAPQATIAQVREALDAARLAGIEVAADLDAGPLDPVVEFAVARIAQEAVVNVVRHAGAQRLWCSVSRADGCVIAEVRDDGDRQPGAPGLGTAGMRERAEALGGTFAAGPQAPRGFTVRAVIPVRR